MNTLWNDYYKLINFHHVIVLCVVRMLKVYSANSEPTALTITLDSFTRHSSSSFSQHFVFPPSWFPLYFKSAAPCGWFPFLSAAFRTSSLVLICSFTIRPSRCVTCLFVLLVYIVTLIFAMFSALKFCAVDSITFALFFWDFVFLFCKLHCISV